MFLLIRSKGIRGEILKKESESETDSKNIYKKIAGIKKIYIWKKMDLEK